MQPWRPAWCLWLRTLHSVHSKLSVQTILFPLPRVQSLTAAAVTTAVVGAGAVGVSSNSSLSAGKPLPTRWLQLVLQCLCAALLCARESYSNGFCPFWRLFMPFAVFFRTCDLHSYLRCSSARTLVLMLRLRELLGNASGRNCYYCKAHIDLVAM